MAATLISDRLTFVCGQCTRGRPPRFSSRQALTLHERYVHPPEDRPRGAGPSS